MPHKLTPQEKKVVQEVAPRPKPAHWWQRVWAKLEFVRAIFRREKGGG